MTKPIASVALMTLYEEGASSSTIRLPLHPALAGLQVWADGTPTSLPHDRARAGDARSVTC